MTEQNIGWAEIVAIDMGVWTLDCYIVLHSDNVECMGVLQAGHSRNSAWNFILQNIVSNFQNHSFWITIAWIPTTDNLANAPLHGIFPSKNFLYPFSPSILPYLQGLIAPSVVYSNLPPDK